MLYACCVPDLCGLASLFLSAGIRYVLKHEMQAEIRFETPLGLLAVLLTMYRRYQNKQKQK